MASSNANLGSVQEPNELSLTSPSSPMLEISVRRDGMHDLQLFSVEDPTLLYHVRNKMFRLNVPAVTLVAGDRKAQGGVIGVCHFAAFSSAIAVGRGDPALNPHDVEWETMVKTSRDHSVYEFSFVGEAGERTSYKWKRTHDPELKGTSSTKWNMRSWKLEEGGTGQVVAVLAARQISYGKEAARLKLIAGKGEKWEQWVLLTYLGLSEKARRRAIARRDLSWFV
ncbi:MAG: hypothetical protein LQ342_008049 [Letrouitia transgressa]|nr:MAG: hypothetical protein LQ342_008049 [Letrouitia transgressa]